MRGALLLLASLAAAAEPELRDVRSLAPSIQLDIRYATPNNFTKRTLYDRAACYLRPAVAEKLARVQAELERDGLRLKVFDCYRPPSVQKAIWALVQDERYVANPVKGSRHNRGAAVDLTLVDRKGRELPMPTPYDDFTEKAHRTYLDLPNEALRNRARLEAVMVKHGFVPLPTEWWHFDDAGWEQYPIVDADVIRPAAQP